MKYKRKDVTSYDNTLTNYEPYGSIFTIYFIIIIFLISIELMGVFSGFTFICILYVQNYNYVLWSSLNHIIILKLLARHILFFFPNNDYIRVFSVVE